MLVAMKEERLAGVLVGTAVGDALGLPFEGMSRRRVRRQLAGGALRHRFLFGRGMVSDDTEQACLLARALLKSRAEPERLASELGRDLRWWLLRAPAGIGWATLRGIVRLWLGFAPSRSGVRSAGNGPAMRAPLLGVFAAEDEPRLRELVRASTLITHTDPRAFDGALAVALAAAMASRCSTRELNGALVLREISFRLQPGPMAELVRRASDWVDRPAQGLADDLGAGAGVSGFVNQTVPLALLCWARNPSNAPAALTEVVALGGDTDTTAAIVGALCGASAGEACFPPAWVCGIAEWPCNVAWMKELSRCLSLGSAPAPLPWLALLLRNVVFAFGVLVLVLRRALPPY